jgi:hypothetical protein
MNSLTKLQDSAWWGGATELMAISAILIGFLAMAGTAFWTLTWRSDSRAPSVEIQTPAPPAPPMCQCAGEVCTAV